MDERGGVNEFYVDRLEFLKYSVAGSVAVWAGSASAGMSEAEAQELFAVDRRRRAAEIFPQGVASGDPRPNGIVLWTRIRTRRRGEQRVAWEISRDRSFRRPLLRGVARTNKGRDHTIKVQVRRTELKPFRTYYYRFIYDRTASRIGRFKTLPAPNAEVSRVRFGCISCQDYTNGYYNALRYLSREDVDYILHLGDYIYETVDEASFQGGGPPERRFGLPPGGDPSEADTLQNYRFLYKKYRSDRDLQRLHENFAFITTWDDHEFANDAYKDVAPDAATGGDPVPARRSAANRAWAEYMPAGVPYDAGRGPLGEILIYRSFAFGNLMELVMTDERLYRDGPPCGLQTQQRYLTPGCGAEKKQGRTMLGATQKRYFLNKILNSSRRWKVWGNEVMFMQFKVANTYLGDLFPGLPVPTGTDGVYVNLDQWDGYGAERAEITRRIRERSVENFVVLTGDIHSFIAGYVKQDYDNPLPTDRAGVCFVVGSVTSSNLQEIATFGRGGHAAPPVDDFTATVEASNPHIEFFDSSTHGYNLVEVTPEALTCTMKAVSTIRERRASLRTLKRFRVPSGQIRIVDTT
ncbi:MAG: alkaline phosphatase D family protein [Actinomycetota bacterium]